METLDPSSLPLIVGAGALLVGLLIGVLLGRRGGSDQGARIRELESQLEGSRAEIERYRSEVADHFTETSRLLHDLTVQYRGVYEHLAEGARSLCPEGAVQIAPGLAEAALPAAAAATREKVADTTDELAVLETDPESLADVARNLETDEGATPPRAGAAAEEWERESATR